MPSFLALNILICSSFLFLRTFIFELWAEKSKLLGNMDIVTGLAAFYHLCFIFNLLYPQVVKS